MSRRSVQEELPHTALTSGRTREPRRRGHPYPCPPERPAVSGAVSGAWPTDQGFPWVDPLPSTDSAAAGWPALFARFVGTTRSSDSPGTCVSDVGLAAFSDRPSPPTVEGIPGVSRFSRMELSRMHRVSDSAASVDGSPSAVRGVAFPLSGLGRHAEVVISELDGWPACPPVNASPPASRPRAHDSGPRWFATPFLYGCCIRYSMPVYPGAYPDSFASPTPRGALTVATGT